MTQRRHHQHQRRDRLHGRRRPAGDSGASADVAAGQQQAAAERWWLTALAAQRERPGCARPRATELASAITRATGPLNPVDEHRRERQQDEQQAAAPAAHARRLMRRTPRRRIRPMHCAPLPRRRGSGGISMKRRAPTSRPQMPPAAAPADRRASRSKSKRTDWKIATSMVRCAGPPPSAAPREAGEAEHEDTPAMPGKAWRTSGHSIMRKHLRASACRAAWPAARYSPGMALPDRQQQPHRQRQIEEHMARSGCPAGHRGILAPGAAGRGDAFD